MKQQQIIFPDSFKGYTCPCCGAFVKTYVRSFNCNMAIALVLMYNAERRFLKVEDLILNAGHKRCGDFSYLRHYGLIEKATTTRKDGSSRNGYYRITEKGEMFCRGEISVKEKFIIERNKIIGFDGNDVFIQKVLTKKFNYNQLMQQL